jgi:hypothetical protein
MVATAALAMTGRLQPQIVNDTASFVEFPLDSLEQALSHHRTPGYPLFLCCLRPFGADWTIVPAAQFGLFVLAAWIFGRGVQRISNSLSAAFVAGSLLASNLIWIYVPTIATDSLTAAAGVAAVGFLLWRESTPGSSRWLLIGSTLTIAAAWLIRPAGLFLVVLIPFLGVFLHRVLRAASHRRGTREFLLLSVLAIAPVLAWCGIRLAVVGRFGVVSFGGYNLIGIAGQFLDKDVEQRLPADLQPIASKAIELRKTIQFAGPGLPESERLNYDRMEWRYDNTIWNVFTPAAEEALHGHENRELNSTLKRLATEIIKLRPREYATWIGKAVRQGTKKLVSDAVLNPVNLAALFVLLALQACVMWRGTVVPRDLAAPAVLLMLAVAYVAANLAVVIPVCPPLGRMTDAAGVLISAPLLAAVCDRTRVLLAAMRSVGP